MPTSWRLDQWNNPFKNPALPPMTQTEIDAAVKYLKDHFYPIPEDCPKLECPKVRPACALGICQIAAGMCGDF